MMYVEEKKRYYVGLLDDVIHFVFYGDYVEERGCDDIKFTDAHTAHVFGMMFWDAIVKDKEGQLWSIHDDVYDLPMFELWRWNGETYSLDDYQCSDDKLHSITLSKMDCLKIADALFRASVDLQIKEWAK